MREAGADIAAAQLLALHADPVRHRSRLTHGRETFPGALHAFRLAQGRVPKGLAKRLSATESDRLREAAEFYIRQVCLWEGATHHQVLGVTQDSPPAAVKEHYHALMALLHPDRQEAGSERWPASAPQRVNQAYAVLSDGALRREYESGLVAATGAAPDFAGMGAQPARSGTAASRRPRRGSCATAARVPHLRTFLAGTAGIACLFLLNLWWVGDAPHEYATLRNATPIENSWRWMREAMSSGTRPRLMEFMGSSTPANPVSLLHHEPPAAVAPVLVPASFALADAIPRTRTDSLPSIEAEEPPPAMPEPARTRVEVPRGGEAAVPMARAGLRSPISVAQAQPPAKAGQPSAQQNAAIGELETLVVQLVSHYEAGDLDRFLGLFDPASLGVIEAVSLRADYAEFFRATGSRQLRLRSIAWEPGSPPSRAKGEADLSAAYLDRPGRIDRVVKLDLSIAWRDGRPWIARMALFPHE